MGHAGELARGAAHDLKEGSVNRIEVDLEVDVSSCCARVRLDGVADPGGRQGDAVECQVARTRENGARYDGVAGFDFGFDCGTYACAVLFDDD